MTKFAIVPLALLLGAVGCSTSSSQSGMLKRQEALLARQEVPASRLESIAAKLESTPATPASVEQQALPLRKQIIRLQREFDEVRQTLRPTHPRVLAMEEQLKGLRHKLSELEPTSKTSNALEPGPAR